MTAIREHSIEPDATQPNNKDIKRLTIDIPASLHRRIKSQCALRGTKIADEIRILLSQHYGDPATKD